MTLPLRANLRLCLFAVATAAPLVFIATPGNYVIAALLTGLHRMPPETYGWIVSLPFWANALQVLLTPALRSRLSARLISAGSSGAQGVCWLLIAWAAGALTDAAPERRAVVFFTLFGLAALVSSFTSVSWSSWLQEWVPPRVRGRFFAESNRWGQVAQIGFILGVGAVITTTTHDPLPFQLLLVFAAGTRLLSAFFMWRMKTRETTGATAEPGSWRHQLGILRRAPDYRRVLAFSLVWAFAPALFGPFYPMYLYDELGVSVRALGIFVILAGVAGSLAYPTWGRIADRHGHKPVIIVSIVLWMGSAYGWSFLTRETAWWLYPMWIFGGATGAGFAISWFTLQLKLIPAEAKTLGISLNLACASLVTAAAPVLGGKALAWLLATDLPSLTVYHLITAVHPTLALASCLLLLRLHEPAAAKLSDVVGAMRNIRTLAGILGLGFLVNFSFAGKAVAALREPPQK